jgi:gamma-glutamyl hercynylcysteine S-oxide hydrolase
VLARSEPARWRSSRPLWADASFASVAPVISSSCVLAAVRSASAGMPADETAAAPFQCRQWLLSHNGIVDRSVLGPHPAAESVCDSAQLAAHLFDFGPERVGEFVTDVGKRDPGARLNLLLTDGSQILATRWHDTLSVLRTEDGVVIASEPYDDDPRWTDVPDHHLVRAEAGEVTITDLEA